MVSSFLPPETERLWEFLRGQQALAGFVLVGGTALALRIQHRVSEDLDFAFTGSKLPRARMDALSIECRCRGHALVHRDNPGSDDEFTHAGMDLRDYQQDFLADGVVKVSFFTTDDPLTSILSTPGTEDGPRVAELDELFESKAIVSASRSKTRDWFDLFTLMREHGFTMRQFRDAFIEHQAQTLYDTAVGRICSGLPQSDDEGYKQLISGGAPSLEEMRDFFCAQRDALEIELAAEARRKGGK